MCTLRGQEWKQRREAYQEVVDRFQAAASEDDGVFAKYGEEKPYAAALKADTTISSHSSMGFRHGQGMLYVLTVKFKENLLVTCEGQVIVAASLG